MMNHFNHPKILEFCYSKLNRQIKGITNRIELLIYSHKLVFFECKVVDHRALINGAREIIFNPQFVWAM